MTIFLQQIQVTLSVIPILGQTYSEIIPRHQYRARQYSNVAALVMSN